MGFSEIILKLTEDFEEQKKKIIEQWDHDINEKKTEIDKKIELMFETKAKEIERQIEENHHSRLLNAKLNQKNQILKKKRELINNVFETAYKEICQMNEEKYISTLIDLIQRYFENKSQIILLSNEDFKKYKEILAKKLKEKNLAYKSIESTDKIEKGLILYDDDKKIETNLSFDSIMKRKKETLENHIGKILHVI